jgi:antitoxin CcdA
MKKFENVETIIPVLKSIVCDCCKKEYLETDVFELEEFINISKINGYGSIFGDGSILELDLCQHCIKNFLGEYIRIKEQE